MTKPLSPVQRALIPKMNRNSSERFYLPELVAYLNTTYGVAKRFFATDAARMYWIKGRKRPIYWVTRQMALRFIVYVRGIQGEKLEKGQPVCSGKMSRAMGKPVGPIRPKPKWSRGGKRAKARETFRHPAFTPRAIRWQG